MKPDFIHILTLGLLLASGPLAAAADDTNSASRLDPSSFDIIWKRNIFNPNRRGDRGRERAPSRAARVDSFTLVGTMSYDNVRLAFFDGTSSQFRRTLKPSETIAGYRIADITPNSIKLSAASNQTVNLTVGMQMRRMDGGAWSLLAHAEPEAPAATPEGLGPAPTPILSGRSVILNGAEGDALKRLMMRRLKEQ